MAKKAAGGRPSIFMPKDGGRQMRIGSLTKDGARAFESARKDLKRLARWPGRVSDADVIDWIALGKPKPPTKESAE